MALTDAQKEAQLRAVGWTPSPGDSVSAAWARTATPADQAAANDQGDGQTGIGQRSPGFTPQDFKDAVTQAVTPFSQQTSGVTAAELAEKKRQFDATLEWTKQMWANQGLPELQIRQQAQALAQQEFEAQHAIAQSNLGLDYLKTAASLGGPADYFQQSNFLRGASANPAVPAFLSALQNNTGLAAFNAPGAAINAPQAQSMATLAGGLTGAAGPVNAQSALNAIGQIGARGGAALAPQALEQLSPDELGLFQSGLKASGFSMPSFLQSYQNSRIAQGAAQAA